jgi:pentatricopeptide repeat protein
MISSFCRGGLFEEAKELAEEFEAMYDKYDVAISNAILCAYCRAGEMESVMRTMRKMDELAISPDYNTFHILIKYFCKEKLYMLAYQTMEDMHRKGHQPAEVCLFFIFNQLSSIYPFVLFLIQLEGFNVSDIELDIIMQKQSVLH